VNAAFEKGSELWDIDNNTLQNGVPTATKSVVFLIIVF
jgi:hypothetical protein